MNVSPVLFTWTIVFGWRFLSWQSSLVLSTVIEGVDDWLMRMG
jgi:hypothetical protein